MSQNTSFAKRSQALVDLGLEPYVLQLEVDGLCVIPPSVTGVSEATVDQMVAVLLDEAEGRVGCQFSLARGPHEAVRFDSQEIPDSSIAEDRMQLTQFLIQQLGSLHRLFRDLAVNPVVVELMRHMIGRRALRFSSHNSFVKWQGAFGYGPSLGLHADQQTVPMPWGRQALTANCNWCLTDYTLDGGALAYVPGSHRLNAKPAAADAGRAVAVEAEKGSVIVFHGATWHGAFPRKESGLRISIANYYRHVMVTSQEDLKNGFHQELADDCADPALFKELAGFHDEFPYLSQSQPTPHVVEA